MTDTSIKPNVSAKNLLSKHAFYKDQIRLETLIRLRWMAIAGQLFTVGFVAYVLKYDMPVLAPLLLIALSGLLNIVLSFQFAKATRVRSPFAGALLCYDVVQLSGLLFLTGGIANPFAILLLAPVTISATSLNIYWTRVLVSLVLVALAVLWFVHFPLPHSPDSSHVMPTHQVFGTTLALICALFFISTYAGRIAHESRQLANALNATEMVLAREQHLSALDGLAAAAAHELGTPLATIALVAKELSAGESDKAAIAEDIALIKEQSDRCRTILAQLTSLQTEGGHPYERLPLDQILEECAAPHRNFGIAITINQVRLDNSAPMVQRNAGLAYGLGNLIENAVDFAHTDVRINIFWNDKRIKIEIIDDGRGFSPDILSKLGDPYTTTRPRLSPDSDPVEPGGLGLGIFIAKTLLERSGAQVTFSNMNEDGHACVTLIWPTSELAIQDGLTGQNDIG